VLKVQYSVQESSAVESSVLEYESGHSVTLAAYGDGTSPLPRRRFTFAAPVTTTTEHHAIQSFYDLKDGVEGAFFYEDEDDTQIPVCFVDDSIERTQKAPGVFGTQFSLEELLNTS